MSNTSKDLLIIYEAEAEQWASYLRFHLVGPIPEAGICCYDIALVTSRRDDFLRLGGYKCKLLILSRGMLEGLCQLRRFFLARVLRPETSVVILMCGVESLDPLLELLPLKGEQCLQISCEQEPQDYRLAIAEIVHKGGQASAADGITFQELKIQKKLSSGALVTNQSLLVLPSRVPCENPKEIFIILQEAMASKEAEVEFSGNKQRVRVKPVNWNESTLKVAVPDFTAGDVIVTLYSKGLVKGNACLQYYTIMEDIVHSLQQAVDPVKFMCQVSSLEKLDQTLASCLMQKMPTGGFQGLQRDLSPTGECHSEDIPTLLHFAVQHGLRDLASALLQCPGSQQALKIHNRLGHTPLDLAHVHGHNELYILLQESLTLDDNDGNTDNSVYELMSRPDNLRLVDPNEEHQDNEDENVYTPLGKDGEEYDTILRSSSPLVIVNRPPAPTPRPDSFPTPEDKTPFIAQVFQKKKSQGDAETLYSLPTRQARLRDSISTTYDTFVPNQPPGLDELIKLQQEVKNGSLSIDDALDRFNDWQRLQKGMDSIQQEKIQQLRASIISNREDDESVYDKISIIHHTPTASPNKCQRASQQADTEFYSKPIKGQNSNFFKKSDKQ
ncbi:B-cell scaffold protein with ankyrin repeats-like isoform X2 [Puntigrus tetrazona]|uniref:B-cell scaffold protein with ankyrin repeats-like isoform X2 n=1 Tax=Puntigrus tetrazona TaxID=1606681 RepID=UPI001C89AF4D|nr:B-cell scaffold protein with ankyrin repeats-like isoform X2 [Puntigrus tetrazona]